MNRRVFIASGFSLAGAAAAPSNSRNEYRFATTECDIQVRIEFHDRYSSHGLCFNDLLESRPLCLSAGHFSGSLAIARYSIQPRSKRHSVSALREHVRTIDRDLRLDDRPPFDRKLELVQGVASDIQAFGYRDATVAPMSDSTEPWYYFRQDLYLNTHSTPFLTIHWKHELSAIRMLDIIPGDGTWPL